MTNIIPVNQVALSLHIENDHAVVSSKTVAEHFGKSHKNVLADISKLECSDSFRELNFQPSVYSVKTGIGQERKYKCYNLTKDGFVFLAMGFTGKRAAHFKEAYINAFNQMERRLTQPHSPAPDFESSIQHCRKRWNRFRKEQELNIRELNQLLAQQKAIFNQITDKMYHINKCQDSQSDAVAHIVSYHDAQRRTSLDNPFK